MNKKLLKVSFENFWPDFSPFDFFIPFTEKTLSVSAIVTDSSNSDLVFTSVFSERKITQKVLESIRYRTGNQVPITMKPRRPNQRSVWFTGENIRPPVGGFDLTFSFDTDTYGGTNVYFPLFNLGLDWDEEYPDILKVENRRLGKTVSPADAASLRLSDINERPGFVCAFVGNPEPIRMRALTELSRVGAVDIYGAAVGRPVPSKYEIAKNYKFMMCFENDLYPGYVTEKPLEAWASGCIPLWRGIDSQGVLNPKSYLNAASFPTLGAFVDEVSELNRDITRLDQMGSEPLFLQELTLETAANALRQIFSS